MQEAAEEEVMNVMSSCMRDAQTRAERKACIDSNVKEQLEATLGEDVDQTTLVEVGQP